MFSMNEVAARLKQRPFTPVRLVTNAGESGESYDVLHPELVLVGRRDIQVGMASKRDTAIYDQVSRVSLLHITAMEDLPLKKGKSNGNGRRTASAD